MPNKSRLNIDFAKLQGSYWIKSPKTGEQCLVIVPSLSRMKRYPTKKEGAKDSLFCSLEVVPLKNPPLDREDTHFVVEPSTREEREQPNATRLPILGSGREYFPFSGQQAAIQAPPPPVAATEDWSSDIDGNDNDEIPF